ncbi:MAG TPA: recombination mediator RecR [Solirubrobacteraceae bacterium]|nr:recombination mediator RecR [Solirubrobacteraceae bacterium]
MSAYAPVLERLIEELQRLPGIGQRSAQRLAFHIMRASERDALALAQAIRDVKERLALCEVCFNFADAPRCAICADVRRDRSQICVVEEPNDVISIERSREYSGLYHVLGGALSPADSIGPGELRIAELIARVRGDAPSEQEQVPVREVILATNPTASGEATALHIAAECKQAAPGVAVSRLASGLPVGSDLEYADEVTVGMALSGRRAL